MSDIFAVILFPSIHYALRAEKIALGKGYNLKLISIPRHLSSDCGVCLRLSWEDKDFIQDLLNQAGIPIEGVHPLSPP